jgi:hypothetical protein
VISHGNSAIFPEYAASEAVKDENWKPKEIVADLSLDRQCFKRSFAESCNAA